MVLETSKKCKSSFQLTLLAFKCLILELRGSLELASMDLTLVSVALLQQKGRMLLCWVGTPSPVPQAMHSGAQVGSDVQVSPGLPSLTGPQRLL